MSFYASPGAMVNWILETFCSKTSLVSFPFLDHTLWIVDTREVHLNCSNKFIQSNYELKRH